MRVLLDTNVILDVLLERRPHAGAAAQVLALVDAGRLEGAAGATSVTTVHYLAGKALGRQKADALVRRLLDVVAIAPIDAHLLLAATRLGFDDFEDAVIHEAARAWGADGLVTRDLSGFRHATLPVFDAPELLAALVAAGD
jgi:predicted nucleic acid-binding protein